MGAARVPLHRQDQRTVCVWGPVGALPAAGGWVRGGGWLWWAVLDAGHRACGLWVHL